MNSHRDGVYVVARRDWDWNGIGISIARREGGKWYVAKPVEFEFHEVTLGQRTEATLRIPWEYEKEFLAAFAEMLDVQGVKTEQDAKIAGTLDATRYHLEDLRRMLKLPQVGKDIPSP